MTSLWLIDMVKGSFFFYPQLEWSSQNQEGAQSSAA